MTPSSNAYCAVLGIHPPRAEDAKSSPDANYYSLLLVALLERAEPMTLEQVAARLKHPARYAVTRASHDGFAVSWRRSR